MVFVAAFFSRTAVIRFARIAAKIRLALFAEFFGVFRRIIITEAARFIAAVTARIVAAESLNQPSLRRSAFVWRIADIAIGFLHSFFKQLARANPDAFSFIFALCAVTLRLNRNGAASLPRAVVVARIALFFAVAV